VTPREQELQQEYDSLKGSISRLRAEYPVASPDLPDEYFDREAPIRERMGVVWEELFPLRHARVASETEAQRGRATLPGEGSYPDLLEDPRSDGVSGCSDVARVVSTGNPSIRHVVCNGGAFHVLQKLAGGRVVAGLTLRAGKAWKGKQSVVIDRVFTSPSARRQGHARDLFVYAKSFFRRVAHSKDLTGMGRTWKRAVGNPGGIMQNPKPLHDPILDAAQRHGGVVRRYEGRATVTFKDMHGSVRFNHEVKGLPSPRIVGGKLVYTLAIGKQGPLCDYCKTAPVAETVLSFGKPMQLCAPHAAEFNAGRSGQANPPINDDTPIMPDVVAESVVEEVWPPPPPRSPFVYINPPSLHGSMDRPDFLRYAAAKRARGKLREWLTYDDHVTYGHGFWRRTIEMHLAQTAARAQQLGMNEAEVNEAIVERVLIDGKGRPYVPSRRA
jgi:GNAT superfamily N-acetyltransferase